MCYPKFDWLETVSPTTMEQHAAYNQQQWNYFNELCSMVHAGDHGDHYNFLLDQLYEGPYWSSVKARLEKPKEHDPEDSVSGTRGPRPTDTTSESSSSSDSDCDWEYVSEIMTESGAA